MSEYRYILQPYKGMKTRYRCFNCNHADKFSKYIDTETNEYLGDKVGRCERLDKCGYHYTPKQYFSDNGIIPDHNADVANIKFNEPEKEPSFIDAKLLDKTLSSYDQNNFITYLKTLFNESTVNDLIDKFKIGTSKHWQGSTIFWQVDVSGRIRTGKIMQYDANKGKRIKMPYDRIQWVHKVTKAIDFNLKQCLFGEHQLIDNKLPIAVVESEKTAIIATGYLPQFTWLASGNKQGLSVDKCNTLKNHNNSKPVILFPDLNAFKDWEQKARLYKFKISDLLEKKGTAEEKQSGLDLADYLTRFEVVDFRVKPIDIIKPQLVDENPIIQNDLPITEELPKIQYIAPKVELWDIPNFEGIEIPDTMIIDGPTKISNVQLCIDAHLSMVEANNGKVTFKPYLQRLQQIHKQLTQ